MANRRLEDDYSAQADDLNRSITMNKLVGLMESGAEPVYHEGKWTVEISEPNVGRTLQQPIDSLVIAQMRSYHLCDVNKRGNDLVCTLRKVS